MLFGTSDAGLLGNILAGKPKFLEQVVIRAGEGTTRAG